MISRANEFLSIGDTVNYYPSFGLPPRTGIIEKMRFVYAKKNDLLMLVKWDMIDQCKIRLASGIVIDGDKLEPFEENKAYKYPEHERMN